MWVLSLLFVFSPWFVPFPQSSVIIELCKSTILDSGLGHEHQKMKVQEKTNQTCKIIDFFIELRHASTQTK